MRSEMRWKFGSQLFADALGPGLFPREVRRRVEQFRAALVVVARAAHELVEDVVGVDRRSVSKVQPSAVAKSKM